MKIGYGLFKTKTIIIISILSFIIFSFTGIYIYNSNIFEDLNLKNMSNGKYLFVLSKTFEDKIKILLVDDNGNVIEEKKLREASSLHSGVINGDKYYFVSERKNRHMIIDKSGKISFFSLMTDKYKADAEIGANSIYSDLDNILMPLNFGANKEGGYTTQLLVKEPNKDWYNIEFNKGYIISSVDNTSKIYGNYMFLGENRTSGLCVFDKNSKTLEKQKEFPHRCFFSSKLYIYNNKLVLYGFDNHHDATDKKARMEVYDPNNLNREKCIIFDDEFIPLYSQNYKDDYVIVGDNDRVKVVNRNFEETSEYFLSDKAMNNEYLNSGAYIKQTEIKDDKLYVLYGFNFTTENKEMPLALHIYDISNGDLLQKIKIKFPKDSEWYCDYSVFSILAE